MKKIVYFLFIAVFVSVNAAFCAEVTQYFNTFYSNYLLIRNVGYSNRNSLNFLKSLSDIKVKALEENLKCAKNKEETEAALFLIEEEYNDLIDNINFELGYVQNCPLNKKEEKKIKKVHKKFMHRLKKNKLKLLR